MDAWEAKQPLNKLVRWPWVGKEELVAISRWHWWYFDRLCKRNALTAEALHREISAKYPCEITGSIANSMARFLDIRWDHYRITRDKLANDNYGWRAQARRLSEGRPAGEPHRLTPEARHVFRQSRPVRHEFPTIRYSPFKPIARPKRLFAEPIIQDRNTH